MISRHPYGHHPGREVTEMSKDKDARVPLDVVAKPDKGSGKGK